MTERDKVYTKVKKAIKQMMTSGIVMSHKQPQNLLHGVTLEKILSHLVEQYGWDELGRHITIKCFTVDPSIKSSLKFLRRTPWARKKVEELYLKSIQKVA